MSTQGSSTARRRGRFGGGEEGRVENLAQACFRCSFPDCGGHCCQQGRPAVERAEVGRIQGQLARALPLLRPEARAAVEQGGWLSHRIKEGCRCVRVVEHWCVFYHQGCVLHRLGQAEGAAWKYKPWRCCVFPLNFERGQPWYVRQKGYRHEAWDLPCLDPAGCAGAAAGEHLRTELGFIHSLHEGAELWRHAQVPPVGQA